MKNEALSAAYLDSLRETLAANDGRLPNTGFVPSEDDWAYQAYAALVLDRLGLDLADFEGCDLISHVAEMDWTATATSPYNYQALLWFAERFADSLQGTDIIDAAVGALLVLRRGCGRIQLLGRPVLGVGGRRGQRRGGARPLL